MVSREVHIGLRILVEVLCIRHSHLKLLSMVLSKIIVLLGRILSFFKIDRLNAF